MRNLKTHWGAGSTIQYLQCPAVPSKSKQLGQCFRCWADFSDDPANILITNFDTRSTGRAKAHCRHYMATRPTPAQRRVPSGFNMHDDKELANGALVCQCWHWKNGSLPQVYWKNTSPIVLLAGCTHAFCCCPPLLVSSKAAVEISKRMPGTQDGQHQRWHFFYSSSQKWRPDY